MSWDPFKTDLFSSSSSSDNWAFSTPENTSQFYGYSTESNNNSWGYSTNNESNSNWAYSTPQSQSWGYSASPSLSQSWGYSPSQSFSQSSYAFSTREIRNYGHERRINEPFQDPVSAWSSNSSSLASNVFLPNKKIWD